VVLQRLRDEGNTVIVTSTIWTSFKNGRLVVDLGPEGGDNGGRIIAVGTPEQICGEQGFVHGTLSARHAAQAGLERKRA